MDATTDTALSGLSALGAHLSDGLIGHETLVERLLIGVLAGGHLLIEGAPGLAKTRAVKRLAAAMDGGFARIHRSRLVRRDAVRRLETLPSGDFTVMLDDGTELRGSRRFRDALG